MSADQPDARADIVYTFTGKVYPERAPIQRLQLTQQLHHQEAELQGTLHVWIQVSQVTVIFSTKEEVKDLATLKNIAEEFVRLAVDIEGYRRGGGYDVEMIHVIPPGGQAPGVFGCGIGVLEQRSPKPDYPDFAAALNAPGGHTLRIALADFREAIRIPKDTGFFCYRAAEALRQMFQNDESDQDKKDSWERMRQTLQIPQADLMFLKTAADAVRHGKGPFISGTDRERALTITSDIIDKAIEYLKRIRPSQATSAQPVSPDPIGAPRSAEPEERAS